VDDALADDGVGIVVVVGALHCCLLFGGREPLRHHRRRILSDFAGIDF